ncbi:hypothetical protein GCM10011273_27850 [Asticcacaulis endophyticus]|uniref:Uncharacterized protein n=1 Tax=Asticcacaulis endophyticus TaxID=1395890 RepID=A0A918QCF5_9CAUL|nr:hypothetical protein GCM10011273_27850 [Asticcacaulis endophyticus]
MRYKTSGQVAAGIVDEHADIMVIAQACFYGREIIKIGEIGLKDVDCNAGLFAQTGGDVVQSGPIAGNKNEVMPAACETIGIDGTNTG